MTTDMLQGEALVETDDSALIPATAPPRRLSRLPSIAQTGITIFPQLVSEAPTRLLLKVNAPNKCYTATALPDPSTPSAPKLQLTVDQSGRFSRTLVFYTHNASDKSVTKLCSLIRDTMHITAGKHYKVEDPKSARTMIAIEVSSSGNADIRVLNSFITLESSDEQRAMHEPRRLKYIGRTAKVLGGEIEFGGKSVAVIERKGSGSEYLLTLAPKLDAFVAVSVAVAVADAVK